MRGGDEPTCLPESHLRVFEADHGRPCPRAELAPQNGAAAELLTFLLDERLRPLAGHVVRARMRWMSMTDRSLLLLRVARALQDRRVSAVFYPDSSRDAKR